MLDREIVLTGPDPKSAARMPAAGKARVDRQRTVDQSDHGADVLAEIRQREGGVGENTRVVLPRLERLPSKIDALAAVCLRLFGPISSVEVHVAARGQGQCRPVMSIDRDRLFEQSQSHDNTKVSVRSRDSGGGGRDAWRDLIETGLS